MLIYAVDDEKNVLKEMEATIKEAVKDADVHIFTRGATALDAIRQGERPDVVFSDIEMPGISGLRFAVELKKMLPDIRIIFTTGYEQYAIEAFKIKVHGYLMKPLTVRDIHDELEHIPSMCLQIQDKLVVRCFGHFDVFWRGEPVIFMRKQSKELFAYLIDRRGAACTTGEIGLALWEKGSPGESEMHRIRNLISDLKKTFREIGMEDALIREHREIAVRKELIDCDYYRFLEGDMDAVDAYHGEYMIDYSWAEMTAVNLLSKDTPPRIHEG